VLEQALEFLLERKREYEANVLSHPPKSMEQLQYLVGKYEECCALIGEIEDILKGKEDE